MSNTDKNLHEILFKFRKQWKYRNKQWSSKVDKGGGNVRSYKIDFYSSLGDYGKGIMKSEWNLILIDYKDLMYKYLENKLPKMQLHWREIIFRWIKRLN